MTSARVHINQLGPDTKPFVTMTSSPPFFNPGIQYPPPKSFLFLFFVHLLGNFESLSVNFLKAGFWKFMMITKFCVDCSFYIFHFSFSGSRLRLLKLLTGVEDAILQFLSPAPFLELQINGDVNGERVVKVSFQ